MDARGLRRGPRMGIGVSGSELDRVAFEEIAKGPRAGEAGAGLSAVETPLGRAATGVTRDSSITAVESTVFVHLWRHPLIPCPPQGFPEPWHSSSADMPLSDSAVMVLEGIEFTLFYKDANIAKMGTEGSTQV